MSYATDSCLSLEDCFQKIKSGIIAFILVAFSSILWKPRDHSWLYFTNQYEHFKVRLKETVLLRSCSDRTHRSTPDGAWGHQNIT